MIYLIAKSDNYIANENFVKIESGAKYIVSDINNEFTQIIDAKSGKSFSVNFYDLIYNSCSNNYVKAIRFKNDIYCIVDFHDDIYSLCINTFEHVLYTEISNFIFINYQDSIEKIKLKNKIRFSHIEYFEKIAVLFFEGEKNFVVIVDENKILYCGYYSEINLKDNILTILHRVHDSINHGVVIKIEKGKFDSYLVYLDDFDLNLKSKFCLNVFLDCVLVGNYNYIENLLEESLLEQIDNLKKFFDDVLDYYPLDETHCVVMKKDATMDIFEFSVIDNKISNITILDC